MSMLHPGDLIKIQVASQDSLGQALCVLLVGGLGP